MAISRSADLLPVRAVDYLLSILNHRVSQGAMVVYLSRRLSTSLLEIASSILFLDFLQKTHLILWAGSVWRWSRRRFRGSSLLVPLGLARVWAVFLSYVQGGFAFLGRFLRAPRLAPLPDVPPAPPPIATRRCCS